MFKNVLLIAILAMSSNVMAQNLKVEQTITLDCSVLVVTEHQSVIVRYDDNDEVESRTASRDGYDVLLDCLDNTVNIHSNVKYDINQDVKQSFTTTK